jgi:phosphoserine aminotransferase
MGGEAQHGMIVLSPKAMQRLQDYKPSWPVPKVLKPLASMFDASPINTPSMLCVLDALDSLIWMEKTGGLKAVQKRIHDNAKVLEEWVARTPWIAYLAEDAAIRSKTSICLRVVSPEFIRLPKPEQDKLIDRMIDIMEQEKVAYDIRSYKSAPLGFRVWGGATVEAADLKLLTQWLDWAYAEVLTA